MINKRENRWRKPIINDKIFFRVTQEIVKCLVIVFIYRCSNLNAFLKLYVLKCIVVVKFCNFVALFNFLSVLVFFSIIHLYKFCCNRNDFVDGIEYQTVIQMPEATFILSWSIETRAYMQPPYHRKFNFVQPLPILNFKLIEVPCFVKVQVIIISHFCPIIINLLENFTLLLRE